MLITAPPRVPINLTFSRLFVQMVISRMFTAFIERFQVIFSSTLDIIYQARLYSLFERSYLLLSRFVQRQSTNLIAIFNGICPLLLISDSALYSDLNSPLPEISHCV